MKIGWWVGSDVDWAFMHFARSVQRLFPKHKHIQNKHGDVNMVASLAFLPKVGADESCICRISGRRVFEDRGVKFDFDEEPGLKPLEKDNRKIIGWMIGNTFWAFRNLAKHVQKAIKDFNHKDNIAGDINIILAPDLLLKNSGNDSIIYHFDGNRIFENDGVTFDFDKGGTDKKTKIIHLIWAKDTWSWGVVYNAIQEKLEKMFCFEAIEFTEYRQKPTQPEDCCYFCQNITQLSFVPENAKKKTITRLGGNMNFEGLEL